MTISVFGQDYKVKEPSRAERKKLKHLEKSKRPGKELVILKLISVITQRIVQQTHRKVSKRCETNRVARCHH